MISHIRETPISSILKRAERFESTDEFRAYCFAGMYSFARGVFVGEQKSGSSFKLPKILRIHEGDFVYSKIMAWEGAFGIVPREAHNCVLSNAFVVYEVDESKIDKKYLSYYFKMPTIWKAIGAHSTGTNVRRRSLHPDQFEKTILPLPPLEEQRRIVAQIEELAAKIEEARGLRREAVAETEHLITSQARNLIQACNSPKTELSQWLDTNRDGIQTGPFGAQLSSEDFVESGIPVLTIGNVQYSGLVLNNLKYVSIDKAQELKRFAVKQGDILFARMGTVGRCCVVPPEAKGWLINYHIIRVALDKSRVDHRYIYWNIRTSVDVKQYLQEKIRGATRQGVNSSIVSSLPMRIPNLADQKRIVAQLEKLQSHVNMLNQKHAETSAELDALLPSILDKAFKGEL